MFSGNVLVSCSYSSAKWKLIRKQQLSSTDWSWCVLLPLLSLSPDAVDGLFRHHNNLITLRPSQVYPLNYRSPRSTKKYSALDVFTAPVGYRIYADCLINFYKRRKGSCYRDFFYIAHRDDGTIEQSKFYCGTRSVRAKSKPTVAAPVLAIAATGNRNSVHGEYACRIFSKQVKGALPNENIGDGFIGAVSNDREELTEDSDEDDNFEDLEGIEFIRVPVRDKSEND